MRTDGQTNTTKLIVAFRYFSSEPKIYKPFFVFTNRITCVSHSVTHTHTHTHTHIYTQEYIYILRHAVTYGIYSKISLLALYKLIFSCTCI